MIEIIYRNPGTRTIEEDLFKALLNAKFIDEDAYDQVQNIQYQRAARTDKGVSAARQVVSLKLREYFYLIFFFFTLLYLILLIVRISKIKFFSNM